MIPIRSATHADRAVILSLAEASGLFGPGDLSFFADDFDGWTPFEGDPHRWLLAGNGAAACLVAPEPMSDAVWNLLFVATHPDMRRTGLARSLIAAVERDVQALGGRMLLIDTASGREMGAARATYAASGHDEEASIRDYYGDGADRITFRKLLAGRGQITPPRRDP